MRRYTQPDLVRFAADCLRRAAVPWGTAAVVASVLVRADAVGAATHGLARLPDYLASIAHGDVHAGARPIIQRRGTGCLTVSANRALGVYALRRTVAAACHSLRRSSAAMAVAVLHRPAHVGRLGDAVEYGLAAGYVTIAAVGDVFDTGAVVSPPGGVQRVLGTNPIAIGVPDGGTAPFLFDASTAATAFYKLKAAADRGDSVPPDVMVDAAGRPSTDPRDFFAGGSIRTSGGHRGFGLSLAAALVGQLGLAAPSSSPQPDGLPFSPTSVLLLLLDPAKWGLASDFHAAVREVGDRVRFGRPAAGPGGGVRIPGDGARARAEASRQTGVPLASETLTRLVAVADLLGIPVPEPMNDEDEQET